jgi:5S rRNA maturation endonuclease (ribonuclease M5)
MKEYISSHTIANEIRMKRSLFLGVFTIVEGPTDSRIYKYLFSKTQCKTVVSHGKEKAVEALKILQKESFQGVIVILDSDFSRVEKQLLDNKDVFYTDTHDIETMILKSPALSRVLEEHGSVKKIDRFIKGKKMAVEDTLFKIAEPIGYLRWVSLRKKLNLKFEELPFLKFINKETLDLNIKLLMVTIKHHSRQHEINDDILIEYIKELCNKGYDLAQICCGHDLIEILSISLRKVLGTNNANDVKREYIEKSLRLAYNIIYFRCTELYSELVKWETNNNPYKIT